jgi:hypothetical protein
MTLYRMYGFAAISVACATGIVGFWWERNTPSVTGQDAAECLASMAEHYAAFDSGTNMTPSWTRWMPQTNTVVFTNYYVDVTIGNVGNYSFSTNILRFYATNWMESQTITVSAPENPEGVSFYPKIKGSSVANGYIVNSGTPGVYNFAANYPVELQGTVIRVAPSSSISFWVRMTAFTSDLFSGSAGTAATNWVEIVPPETLRVDPPVRLSDIQHSLGTMRRLLARCGASNSEDGAQIAWADPEEIFSDGDVLSSVSDQSFYATTNTTGTGYQCVNWYFNGDSSNRFSNVITLADRASGSEFLPWTLDYSLQNSAFDFDVFLAATNHVVARWTWPSISESNSLVYAPSGDYWTHEGISTQAYLSPMSASRMEFSRDLIIA